MSKHAFPHDFRSGPSFTDWDPSKWIIVLLNRFGLAYGLRRARAGDVQEAANHMLQKRETPDTTAVEEWQGDVWSRTQLNNYVASKVGVCVVIVDGFAVDVTAYCREHVCHGPLCLTIKS